MNKLTRIHAKNTTATAHSTLKMGLSYPFALPPWIRVPFPFSYFHVPLEVRLNLVGKGWIFCLQSKGFNHLNFYVNNIKGLTQHYKFHLHFFQYFHVTWEFFYMLNFLSFQEKKNAIDTHCAHVLHLQIYPLQICL